MHSIHALPARDHHESNLSQQQSHSSQAQSEQSVQSSASASVSVSVSVSVSTSSATAQVPVQSSSSQLQESPSSSSQSNNTNQEQQMHTSSQEIHATSEGGNMILLESLNPQVAPSPQQGGMSINSHEVQLTTLLDPTTATINQQSTTSTSSSSSHLVQHLVQPPSNQQQQQLPHLHQLQPSHNSASMDSIGSQLAQHTLDESPLASSNNNSNQTRQQQTNHNNLLRQRPQIEGIVAEGGGPIVQWLLDNYEIADGESLPRSTVYNHYLAHCRSLHMASVNAASFGKLIRSVFVGLKTRRLGTRGHSKYHYFGVRAKQHCEQELLQHQHEAGCSRDHNENSNQNTDNGESDNSDSTTNNGGQIVANNDPSCGRLSSNSSGKRVKRSHGPQQVAVNARQIQLYQEQQQHDLNQQQLEHQQQQQQQLHHHHHHHHLTDQQHEQQDYHYSISNSNGYASLQQQNFNKTTGLSNNQQQHLISNSMDRAHCELVDFSNHLGANWTTLVDEHWPQRIPGVLERQIIKATGSNEIAELLEPFEQSYKLYYRQLIELLSKLKFMEVEMLTQEFWHPTGVSNHDLNPTGVSNHDLNPSLWIAQANGTNSHQQLEAGDLSGNNQMDIDYHQQLHQSQQLHHQPQPQPQPQQHLHHHQQAQTQPQTTLTFHQLYQLTSQPVIIARINQIDYNLYEAIESFLLPDMLSPIPRALAQHIRQFAKNIAPWIEMAVKDYEPQFVVEKSKSALAFGSALRRYTSLNHLSTASRAIWDKRSALAQMSLDLSRVDLRDIEHQVSLMSRCNNNTNSNNNNNNSIINNSLSETNDATGTTELHSSPSVSNNIANQQDINTTGTTDSNSQSTINNPSLTSINNNNNNENNNNNINNNNLLSIDHQHQSNHHNHLQHTHHMCAMQPAQIIQNFLHLLEDPYPANSWPDWCRNLVESRVCGLSTEEARNFVLKWNFYISLIMKELTLRSAPSFGSFQLIRLLFDEYIFYLVVSRLAQAQHKTPGQLLSL